MSTGCKNFKDSIEEYLENPKIGYLFILMIVFLSYISVFLTAGNSPQVDLVNYSYFYLVSSYLIIAFGMIFFRRHGLRMLSDRYFIWLLIITCFLRPNIGGGHDLAYRWFFIFLGLAFSFYAIKNKAALYIPDKKIVVVGLFWSIGTVLIIVLVQLLLSSNRITAVPSSLLNYVVNAFFYETSSVVIVEEVFFRGLIIGCMLINGYSENTALFVQAILFWGVHYMYAATNPLWLFTGIPLLTLSTTLIMKKHKTIFLPILVHTFLNVFIYFFFFLLQRFFT